MVTLRALAIASNIAFLSYGYLGELWPILTLHAAMLPMNMYHLRQALLLEHTGDTVRRRQREDNHLVALLKCRGSGNSGSLDVVPYGLVRGQFRNLPARKSSVSTPPVDAI